jgi:hypothetical protein
MTADQPARDGWQKSTPQVQAHTASGKNDPRHCQPLPSESETGEINCRPTSQRWVHITNPREVQAHTASGRTDTSGTRQTGTAYYVRITQPSRLLAVATPCALGQAQHKDNTTPADCWVSCGWVRIQSIGAARPQPPQLASTKIESGREGAGQG